MPARRAARGDLLLFLNNDTEVIQPDWLDELVRWAELPHIGIVGAKLLYPDRTIQHAGVVFGLGLVGHIFARAAEGASGVFGSSECYRNYLAVTGACQMMRRDVFQRLGGFDERFRLTFSDVVLCMEAWKAGYRVVYTPHARLVHHESYTRKRDDSAEDMELLARYLRDNRFVRGSLLPPRTGSEVFDTGRASAVRSHAAAGRPRLRRPRACGRSGASRKRPPVIDVSIIIPVLNKLEFTRQCLDRIWRNTGDAVSYEVIVVDNASTRWDRRTGLPTPASSRSRYDTNGTRPISASRKANNAGARLSRGEYLLFLNNDTLVQPGWLTEMLRVSRSDAVRRRRRHQAAVPVHEHDLSHGHRVRRRKAGRSICIRISTRRCRT